MLTPTAAPEKAAKEHDYFHSRQDSVASEDSGFSFHLTSNSFSAARSVASNPNAQSSQTSLTTTAQFAKKSSFASLRNAFKSAGKSLESHAPPVPILDRQAYPALRNPFSRSTSSLAHHTPSPSIRRPSVTTSPPNSYPRPSTPGSYMPDHKHARALSVKAKAQGHVHGRSQHSHSGSVFHNSDAGSDYSFGGSHAIPRQSTPPPVPRVPNDYGAFNQRIETPIPDAEDKVVIDPRTPSDFALHAVFMHFAASAENKIDMFLRQSLERELSLNDFMGLGVDTKFDEILQSLGQIAVKTTKPVIDSIMRWRKSQTENVSTDIINLHSSSSSSYFRSMRPQEIIILLNERKSLASIYIMCRALITVVQSVPRDSLGEALGYNLEETTFEQFKRPDMKLLTQSINHQINAELFAELLGKLSNIR